MEINIANELIKNTENFVKSNSFSASQNKVQHMALDYLKEKSIPNKKDEDWIYSNLYKNICFRVPSTIKIDAVIPLSFKEKLAKEKDDFSEQWVFINGEFENNLSQVKSRTLIDLFQGNSFKNSYHALNHALKPSLKKFFIEKNSNQNSIKIYVYNTKDAFNKFIALNFEVLLEKDVKASILIENFNEEMPDLNLSLDQVVDLKLLGNAQLELLHIHHKSNACSSYSLINSTLDKNATITYHLYDLGSKTARHHFESNMDDKFAHTKMYGAMILNNECESDIFTKMNHQASETSSDQDFRSILNQSAHGAFFGRIDIKKGASKIDSAQLNKNLLLSKKARIDTRPQLLVANDDVKCAHGATIGRLSSEEEFYLISRGFSKEKARKLLASGFVKENIFKINNDLFKNYIFQIISDLEI